VCKRAEQSASTNESDLDRELGFQENFIQTSSVSGLVHRLFGLIADGNTSPHPHARIRVKVMAYVARSCDKTCFECLEMKLRSGIFAGHIVPRAHLHAEVPPPHGRYTASARWADACWSRLTECGEYTALKRMQNDRVEARIGQV